MAAAKEKGELLQLSGRLMQDIQNKSEERRMSFHHDTLTVQCIIPKRSKAIIDQIDKALGRYLRLTVEEVDFIINYDVKYRMGQEGPEDAE